jgi:hypothetical protein
VFLWASLAFTQPAATPAKQDSAKVSQTPLSSANKDSSQAKNQTNETRSPLPFIATLILLLGFVGGLLWYFHRLQKQFLEACTAQNAIKLFAQSPFGLPRGSISAGLGFLIVFFALSFFLLSAAGGASLFAVFKNMAGEGGKNVSLFDLAAGGLLFLIVGGVLVYMYIIQRQFFKGCQKKEQLVLYSQSPLGLPIGSIRSILALIIVLMALGVIGLSIFKPDFKIPEALTAVLGSVLGFYFGSRTAQGKDEGLKDQLEETQKEKEAAVNEKDQSEADTLLGKIQKGIKMSKTVMDILPEDVRKKYGGWVEKLEKGLATAESLSKLGKAKEAVEKAKDVFEVFKKANPFKELLEKAGKSFGRVLGGSAPPLALIGGVVTLGVKLAGGIYAKWKARVLHAPITPDTVPLKVIDANTGFSLFASTAIFKAAFAQKLMDNNFLNAAPEAFRTATDLEKLWQDYKNEGRFDSREQFITGLEEFLRAAAARELQQEIDPATLEAAGGPQMFSHLDKLHGDPEAFGDLDNLVNSVEHLQQNGEPVLSIFEKVKQEMAS